MFVLNTQPTSHTNTLAPTIVKTQQCCVQLCTFTHGLCKWYLQFHCIASCNIGEDSLEQKEQQLSFFVFGIKTTTTLSVNRSELILQYYHRQAAQHINEQTISQHCPQINYLKAVLPHGQQQIGSGHLPQENLGQLR